jgi:Flp pilus assembly protein TadG
MRLKASQEAERGSAVVDFVLTSFALLALFGSAMAIITNLYLRTVLTNAATDAARTMARADVSRGCGGVNNEPNSLSPAQALAIEIARQSTQALVGDKLVTQVSAHTSGANGFCTAIVTIAANLPGLPLMTHITNFEATAHATLELQQ